MPIAILTLELIIPECFSLKQKRSRLKPVLNRLHREFNISITEAGFLDSWQNSAIVAVMVGADTACLTSVMAKVVRFCERTFPDIQIVSHRIEII